MKILENILKYTGVLLLVLFLIVFPGLILFNININFNLAYVFNIGLIVLMITGIMLSLNSVYVKYKDNPSYIFKDLTKRILLVFTIVSLANFLKSRGINIRFDMIFTLLFVLLSYYLEEKKFKIYFD